MGTRDLQSEAETYAMRHGLELCGRLGDGTQGKVWAVRGKGNLIAWALKIQASARDYQRERDCYLRLQENGVAELAGFHVPLLIRHDDEALAIEMTIVTQPFVVDFAQVYRDFPPDFSAEVWAETHERWRASYGDDWPRVRGLLAELESLGIYYLDVHRGNISI